MALLVINDKTVTCGQCGLVRLKQGQTTWEAQAEHLDRGCKK